MVAWKVMTLKGNFYKNFYGVSLNLAKPHICLATLDFASFFTFNQNGYSFAA